MNMGRARYVANAWAGTEDDESACHDDEVVVMDGSRKWLERLSVVIVLLMI
jgi:hypothetical protein